MRIVLGPVKGVKERAGLFACLFEQGRERGEVLFGLALLDSDAGDDRGAIVKTCGSRSLSGFRLGVLAGPFDHFAVDEDRSGADQGDEMRRVDGAPAVLR